MKQFIFMNRNGIEIFDAGKSAVYLGKALAFLKEVAEKGGQILLVATQPEAKAQLETLAQKLKEPYVVNRWLGGTLTNFTTLSKRVEYFKKLKSDQESGALEKYTKKERVDFNKEITRLSTLFSGVQDMPKLPQAVVIINANTHDTALREAKRMKIPVVALINTDTNPENIEYPIPGNDANKASINWFLGKVEEALSGAQVKESNMSETIAKEENK